MTKSTGRSRLAAQFDAVTSQDMGFDDATAPWMNWMLKHLNEIQQTGSKPTPFTVEVFKHTTYPPLGNYTPESCAATVCAALEETDYASTHNASAASYATYGTPCELKPGCIVVFAWPDGGHHVNFCHDIIDGTTFRGLGGNQSHSLDDAIFARQYITATRWPVKRTAAALTLLQTVNHSQMHLGKRHARHDLRVPAMAKYVPTTALPPPPESVDWYSKVRDWGVMANDHLGDCTCAAIGHIILQWSTYSSSAKLLADDQIIGLYEAVSGYNPADPTTDQGAVETDVLTYWLNQGVFGDKLNGFASIEVGNTSEVRDAINWFGNVYVGLRLPRSAQTQEIWAVPPGGAVGEGAPGSWGGHAVPVVGYDIRGLYCVTWGAIKRMTYGFWAAYCDEAYALLSRDFVAQNSEKTPAGLKWEQLEADMSLLKSGFSSAKTIRHM